MQRTLSAGEFHGRRRDTVRHAGLTLADTEYEPGHRLPMHAHENPFFSLLVRGHFDERLDSVARRCHPTSLVFYPEHEPHGEAFGDDGGRSFNVELGPEWLDRLRDEGAGYPAGSRLSMRGRANLLAARLHTTFLRGGPEVGYEEIVLEMLSEVGWTGVHVRESRAPAWLDRVRDVLHARYREQIRVGDLADEVGVHPVHVARVFRQHHRCTIGSYVHTLRIEHARTRLADPDARLSSIAFETGFADQAHLTRRFKELMGVPPGTWREMVMTH